MTYTFKGFPRSDGSIGIRNHIGIISTVICSSVVTDEIANQVPDSVSIVHTNGCAQLGDDFQVTKNMLSGVAENPNIYGALLVGLGCETNQVGGLLSNIPKIKPIEGFSIQQMEGGENTITKGVSIGKSWANEAKRLKRKDQPLSDLKIGLITEDIDETSLKAVTPVISGLINLLNKNGATIIYGITNTLEPAADLISENAINSVLSDKIKHLGENLKRERWEDTKKQYKDIEFSEYIKNKAEMQTLLLGENKIQSLLNYNEKPLNSGLHLIKASSSIVETLSNFASIGCHISLTISKREVLTSSNLLPCLTVVPKNKDSTTNQFVDYEVTQENTDDQVNSLIDKIISISSGELTKLEEYELGEFAIPHVGTTF